MKRSRDLIWPRLVRFGIVGALGVVVNSVVLFVTHGIAGLPLLVASPLAVEVAILHNFAWNERWTFGASGFSLARLGKFNLTSLGGLLITSGVLYLLVSFAGFHYLLANLVGIALAMAWNFTTSLLWTWGWEP
ncbi:MAG: GtrA family protein [Sphingomonadaceae bacterium]